MIAVILALILSIVHSFSRTISKIVEEHHINITSFSAGMFITLMFLEFLPMSTNGIEYGVPVFLLLTIGFIMFHLSEKYFYQHVKNKKELLKELAHLHNLGFFINHLMVGFVLVLIFELKSYTSYLIIMPFLLHTISSSISLEHIHARIGTRLNKIMLNLSTFLGALFAYFADLKEFWYYTFFAFFLGALLYISIRDMLPSGKRGNLLMFAAGFLLTVAIIALL